MLTLFFIILLTILILFFFKDLHFIKQFALSAAGFILVLACILVATFDTNQYFFQHLITLPLGNDNLNIIYMFGLDGISVYFFFLSCFLIFLCILFI
jgi:NADH:ubiquinone oxidoreductase subunit 4 (subunit M)